MRNSALRLCVSALKYHGSVGGKITLAINYTFIYATCLVIFLPRESRRSSFHGHIYLLISRGAAQDRVGTYTRRTYTQPIRRKI